jgi:outer membrane receptor for ferrienterochelin and colicins
MNCLAAEPWIFLCLLTVAGAAQDLPVEKGTDSTVAKPESVLFDALPVVEAASLHAQTLLEAPASVTVITDEDIRRRGYRTLADVLSDVRGMYVSYDRAYYYVGVRGFSTPGDPNTRLLVMINGHSLTENVLGSANLFGQDFGLDLDLIKRIEIVRGPSSALYGTNGMFATINIVTKSPVEYAALRTSAELDSFGERKAQVSGSEYLGHGANLLVSVSVFNNTGQSPLFFPGFDTPQTNNGLAVDMDGGKGYHTFANLIWQGWSFLAYFNNSEKIVPTAAYGTIFNDRGDKFSSGRDFVESRYQRDIGTEGKLSWRVYYDRFRDLGRYDFATPGGVADAQTNFEGDWMGTELTYRFRVPLIGFLTLGSVAEWDLRSQIEAYYVSPVYLSVASINRPDRSLAVFFQDEWALSKRWTLYLGGRVDDSRNHQLQLTPRVALVYQPDSATAVKLLYGRSFRNPSPFEQYYGDGVSQIPNPDLDSEKLQTFEVALERQVSKKIELLANVYQYRLGDLIQATLVNGLIQQYQNLDSSRATGVELEAVATLGAGLKLDASLALQKASAGAGDSVTVNSPTGVGKLLLDSPVWRNRWSLSGGLQYLSERLTLTGGSVPPVYLVNFTAAGRRLPGDMELQIGIRNLFNYRYWDPAGRVQEMASIQQDGRSCFVRVSWAPQRTADQAQGHGAAGHPGKER